MLLWAGRRLSYWAKSAARTLRDQLLKLCRPKDPKTSQSPSSCSGGAQRDGPHSGGRVKLRWAERAALSTGVKPDKDWRQENRRCLPFWQALERAGSEFLREFAESIEHLVVQGIATLSPEGPRLEIEAFREFSPDSNIEDDGDFIMLWLLNRSTDPDLAFTHSAMRREGILAAGNGYPLSMAFADAFAKAADNKTALLVRVALADALTVAIWDEGNKRMAANVFAFLRLRIFAREDEVTDSERLLDRFGNPAAGEMERFLFDRLRELDVERGQPKTPEKQFIQASRELPVNGGGCR